jgi:flagellar basal body-associated protein FliL
VYKQADKNQKKEITMIEIIVFAVGAIVGGLISYFFIKKEKKKIIYVDGRVPADKIREKFKF